ncbi:MAG: hypothetical protein RBT16_10900, partial [Desulfococcus multivorans]|nr:hypothetical protein [Desulfococcus multivorans]
GLSQPGTAFQCIEELLFSLFVLLQSNQGNGEVIVTRAAFRIGGDHLSLLGDIFFRILGFFHGTATSFAYTCFFSVKEM